MALQELRGRRRLVVELGDLTVPPGVVVVRVDDDLAGQRFDRHRADRAQRDRHDGDLGGRRHLGGGRGARVRPELGDEVRERLGAARVADDDVVAVRDGEAGEL